MASGLSLNIDTTKSEFQNPMVELRQGDGNYQSLRVTVTSNGEPLMLDGWTISFMGTTAGGHKIVDSDTHVINASNGVFDYTPTKAWGQDIGEFDKAYFKFTKGDEAASGANFRVKVFEAVDLTDEEAGDYISVVDVMIDKIKTDMDNKLANTQKTLSDTQSQATTVQGNVDALNTNVNDLKAQNNNIRTANNVWSGTNKFNSGATFSPGIEITADLPFIDFHYGNDTSDYTSRIIEDKKGTLSFYSNDGVKMFLNANANDPQAVHNTGDETINGNKTFTSPINGKTIKIELPNGTDLNNVTAYGSYSGYGTSFLNLPTSSELQFDMVIMQQGVFSSQIIISYTGDTSLVHYRSLVNGVWQPWKKMAIDTTVVHNTGTETIAGDKDFTGNSSFTGQTTLKAGNYGLRVTISGVQKTSDGGTTWVNI